MQAYNISHDTFVPLVPGPNGTMIQDPSVPDEDCNVIRFTQLEPEKQSTPAQNKYGGECGGEYEVEIDLDDIDEQEVEDEEEEEEDGKKKKKKKDVKMVEREYCFRFY